MEKNNLEKTRHSLSHIMALAVSNIWPEVKLGIGPSVDNGFYYDFDFGDKKITNEDLEKIENEMKKIIEKDLKFEESEINIEEAIKKEKENNQNYKVELLKDLKSEGEDKVSYYKLDNFEDLCKGPHLKSSGQIKKDSFKIAKISGAYWRGSEDNQMLTRIYGYAFESKEKLNQYLEFLKEAEKRDHRKIGKDLDLFCFSDLIGSGLPLFTPRGTILIDELQKKIEKICKGYGFQKIRTPHLAKIKTYELSGHAKKFSEELFRVHSERDHNFVIRPVLCPHQTQVYASKIRSYRDLPIRYMESEKMYRAEKQGEVGGLNRVYGITVEDGHSFCRVDQVKDEVKSIVSIIKDFYSLFGLWGNHKVSLSVRDYSNQDKYIGEKEDWDLCENMLKEISDEMELGAQKQEGEAAVYGPKLDFIFKDALGREIQIPTVQIDFAIPKRFGLSYIDESGEKQFPVIVHRAVLGSYERFIALLIEHYMGSFPFWLSPEQIRVVSVSEKQNDACLDFKNELLSLGFRAEEDISDETVGNKIRKGIIGKVPYLIVIGEKEIKSGKISVRERENGKTIEMNKDDFFEKINTLNN